MGNLAKTREVGFNDAQYQDAKDLFTPLNDWLYDYNIAKGSHIEFIWKWDAAFVPVQMNWLEVKKAVHSLKGFDGSKTTVCIDIIRPKPIRSLDLFDSFELPSAEPTIIETRLKIYFDDKHKH